MPTVSDFRTTQVQAIIFTPGLQFRTPKVLSQLLARYIDRFDGEPITFPPFPVQKGPPPKGAIQMHVDPQITLQSENGELRLEVNRERLSVTLERKSIDETAISQHLDFACELGLNYLTENNGKAGRVACIANRLCDELRPASFLARHFCKEKMIEGPLNRPEEFQLHAHKRFTLGSLFTVNSWMRFKTVGITDKGEATFPPNKILAEQDFNSLSEEMESREIPPDEIHGFFDLAPGQMHKVLELYLS